MISPIFPDMGITTISPLLKKSGHSIKLLFLPHLMSNCSNPLPKKLLERIIAFLAKEDIVGINCFSENYSATALLVDNIRKGVQAPLVWGGVHATLRPEDCIGHADIVCVGEGEEAMVELAEKMQDNKPLDDIKNLLFRSHWPGQKTTELRAPINLDSLLPLDYELKIQYIAENNKIRNVRESDHNGTFHAFSSRSCPFRCSYCCNATIHDIYKGQKFFRQRNVDKVIDDAKSLKERFPSCRVIWFNEADFLSGKTNKTIEHFSNRYKKEVGVPFSMWSHPAPVTGDNIRMLKNAGLFGVNIGTIGASAHIQHSIYKRNASSALYKEKALILNKHGIHTEYDFILCNPYENEDDVIDTILLLMSLVKPFYTVVYILTYFQKTELYKMALKDNFISENSSTQSYTKAAYRTWKSHGANEYLYIIASMMRGKAKRIPWLGMDVYGVLPDFVLKFLIKKSVVRFISRIPLRSVIFGLIGNVIMFGDIVARKIKAFLKKS